jgi:hypothetical protein
MKTLQELRDEIDRQYPSSNYWFLKPGITANITRQNLGFDTLNTYAFAIVGQCLNVSYTYEPQYVNAHQASFGYYLGKGKWLRWEFSWPRLSSRKK